MIITTGCPINDLINEWKLNELLNEWDLYTSSLTCNYTENIILT